MRTTAVLLVDQPAQLGWLGDRRVAEWSMAALQAVRGVDQSTCCALATVLSLCQRAALPGLVELPSAVHKKKARQPRSLYRWLVSSESPARGADVILVSNASFPLLRAAALESCLVMVQSGDVQTAMPIAQRYRYEPFDLVTQNELRLPLPEVVAYRSTVPESIIIDTGTVPVGLWESLSYQNEEMRTLIHLLVDQGEASPC